MRPSRKVRPREWRVEMRELAEVVRVPFGVTSRAKKGLPV